MGIGVSLILIAAGAILVWGVNGDIGSVNEDAIGWILMIVGIVGLILSMIFWSSWAGPGYWTRRRGGGHARPWRTSVCRNTNRSKSSWLRRSRSRTSSGYGP